jgi:hypothetical protein
MMWTKILKISLKVFAVVVGLMLLISALLVVFKDNIKGYALDEVNKYLNKRVHIGYIDIGIWGTFPDMALDFDNVLIYSKFDTIQTADTAFFAQKLRLRFNPFDFLKGSYSVNKIDLENGLLNLEVRPDGKVNYDFLKPSESDEPSNFSFSLEKIRLRNLKFSYKNGATEQYYAGFTEYSELSGDFTNEEFLLDATLGLDVHEVRNKLLTLMTDKRATCAIQIHMDQVNNVFEIQQADLRINSLPFFIKGKVTADSMDFFIKGDELQLTEVVRNFSVQELDVVTDLNGSGMVDIEVMIRGGLEATASPAIDAKFHVDNGAISDQEFQLKKIILDGIYSNGVATGLEQLNISNIQFVTLGNTFKGNVVVTDFDKPRLKGKAIGTLDLKAAHRIFGPFGLQQLAGSLGVNGNFDLRMNDPKNQPLNLTIYDLRSQLNLSSIVAQFKGDTRVFSLPSGELVIRNQQAGFRNVAIQLQQSDILINGTFDNVANYFKKEGQLNVEATVESKRLYLDELSVESEGPTKRTWLLPDDIRGIVSLSLNDVYYGGHTYSQVRTRLKFDKKALHFPALTAKNAGADIKGSLSIVETQPMLLVVDTRLTSPNVRFDLLFKEWNNFDQETIRAENIKGTAQIDLWFKGPFNLYTGEDLKKQFVADVDIRIKEGALTNVATFKEITGSLRKSAAKLVLSKENIDKFENQLMNLRFQTFENRLSIRNGVLTIPRMEIQSNALDIKVSGIHSFENQVDYSFDFRFKELKGKGKQTEFGDVMDDGSGFRIYLRMYGDLFDPQFMWDRDAQKLDKQLQREAAKDDFKSVLKEGFGINKKDTTIRSLDADSKRKETIEMDFGRQIDSLSMEFDKEKKEKKKTRLGKLIDQWSEENKKEQEKFDLDGD